MTQEGIVVLTDDEDKFATVSVKQSTACDGCHKKDGCASCTSFLEVRAHNDCMAKVGDRVEITVSSGRVLFYAFAVFIFPFFPAAIAYFVVDFLIDNKIFPMVVSFGALAATFLLLRLTLDKKSRENCDGRISKIIERHKIE